ncbi:MAG: hypothetical protein AB1446_07875 [Bacillota bacterium]
MDWPRAKNILIIAFLGVNLLLGYRLWAGPATPNASLYRVTAREVREVTAQLRERGVVLAAEIPRRARPLPLLTVSNPQPDPAALAARFLGAGAKVVAQGEVWVGRKGQEAVVIYPGGEVFYRRLPASSAGAAPGSLAPAGAAAGSPAATGGGEPDATRAVQLAREFWAQRGGLPAGGELDYRTPVGGGRYLVVFTCKTAGHRFFGSRAMALVGPHGVEEAYAAWPVPEKPSGSARPILPATEALVRAVPFLVKKGAVVVQVEAGFYSPVYDAREWEAVPVWRVRLGSGTVLYVNAYTGELEGLDQPYPRQGQEMFGPLQKQTSQAR